MINRVFLLLGSNLDREKNIFFGQKKIDELLSIKKSAKIYESIPFPLGNQPNFLNTAMMVETSLTYIELKNQVLRVIERQAGRVRGGDKLAINCLDIDIIFFNKDIVHEEDKVIIPDPDSLICPHVALPVADLEPDFIHPLNQRSLESIAAQWRCDTSRCWLYGGSVKS